MQLVEQGKLSLDEPIAAVLPELGERTGAGRVRGGWLATGRGCARAGRLPAAIADAQFRLRLRRYGIPISRAT